MNRRIARAHCAVKQARSHKLNGDRGTSTLVRATFRRTDRHETRRHLRTLTFTST